MAALFLFSALSLATVPTVLNFVPYTNSCGGTWLNSRHETMDEFEEFAIRSYRGYTEEDSDHHLGHDRNHSHLISEKLHGCIDVTEIFPSPIDICEVKKAWYGDQSENIADCSQQCTRFGSTEAPRQGHGRCRAGPDDSAQQTTINTISRSCRTDSVKCLQRSVSATNKVIGAYRTAAVSERTTSASTGDTPTSKLASVGSLATSLSSSSSSSSSPSHHHHRHHRGHYNVMTAMMTIGPILVLRL